MKIKHEVLRRRANVIALWGFNSQVWGIVVFILAGLADASDNIYKDHPVFFWVCLWIITALAFLLYIILPRLD